MSIQKGSYILLISGILLVSLLSGCSTGQNNSQSPIPSPQNIQPALTPFAKIPHSGIYVFASALNDRKEIFKAEIGSETVSQLTESQDGSSCPAFSPDRLELAYCSSNNGENALYLASADGLNPKKISAEITDCGCSPDAPLSWSRDGKWIVLPVSGTDKTQPTFDIYIVSSDGSKAFNLTSSPQRYGGVIWNPDSRSILFMGKIKDATDIYRMNINDRKIVPFSNTPISGAATSWSPDGKSLVYFADSGQGNFDIFKFTVSDGKTIRLTDAPGFDSYPRFINDNQILFISKRDGDDELYIMNSDGSNQQNISNDPGVMDIWPSASPDGEYIIYLTVSNNKWDSWIMKNDGSDKTKLTDMIGVPSSITWKP